MLKATLLKWLTDTAMVTEVSDPSAHFRFLTLRGEIFKSKTPAPGDKIRVVVDDTELRTYTRMPLSLGRKFLRMPIFPDVRARAAPRSL
jgi:hypothetical protein